MTPQELKRKMLIVDLIKNYPKTLTSLDLLAMLDKLTLDTVAIYQPSCCGRAMELVIQRSYCEHCGAVDEQSTIPPKLFNPK